MARRRPEELLGTIIWEACPDVVGSLMQPICERAMRDQVSVHFDMFYPPYDSWFEHHVYPLPESSPFFRDVTARKEAERKIQQLNESCRPRDRELEESKLLFGKMKALKISMTP